MDLIDWRLARPEKIPAGRPVIVGTEVGLRLVVEAPEKIPRFLVLSGERLGHVVQMPNRPTLYSRAPVAFHATPASVLAARAPAQRGFQIGSLRISEQVPRVVGRFTESRGDAELVHHYAVDAEGILAFEGDIEGEWHGSIEHWQLMLLGGKDPVVLIEVFAPPPEA